MYQCLGAKSVRSVRSELSGGDGQQISVEGRQGGTS